MSTNDNEPRLAPETDPADADKPHTTSIAHRIRNRFLTGLVVAGPLAITAYLTWWFIKWVDGLVTPFIPVAYRPETYLPIQIPGLGLIIGFVGLTLLGFLTANLVGRTLVELGEIVLGRMPIIRPIYKALKQLFTTIFSSSGSAFRRVGLVEFPAPGMWSLVFVSAPAGAEISSRLPGGEEYVSVFLPCTPNPTTGFFFYVQRREIIELDITSEAAATLIVSAGMIQPSSEQQKKLSAFAEAALVARNARNGRSVITAK
jgi:uncharacterized membrane protein